MQTVNLRKVGGSLMLAIPPSLVSVLGFSQTVNLDVQDGKLIVIKSQPSYCLEALLAEHSSSQTDSELQDWINDTTVSGELL